MSDKNNSLETQQCDVLIIGAGPSGASAAAMLKQRGYQVIIVERQHFPRFVIGESLLPQCMEYLDEAGLLEAVSDAAETSHFQFKDGAAFMRGKARTFFDFTDKFTPGPGTTWQVRRGPFDHILATAAAAKGATLRYGETLMTLDVNRPHPLAGISREDGSQYQIEARFVLDASGYGRVLPRLLQLEIPSTLPLRRAVFSHVEDNISDPQFDRNKILITVHAHDYKTWFWLIPFTDGRSSLGVVAEPSFYNTYGKQDNLDTLFRAILASEPELSKLLTNARLDTPFREINGYSANVTRLSGDNFVLLGNAGEFLDPVFSSGVTIALKSSSLCVPLLDRYLQGEKIDWQQEYEQPLRVGIEVFRAYVEAWYHGSFQDIVFSEYKKPEVQQMVSAILAGYAWDQTNPVAQDAPQHIKTLQQYCQELAKDAQSQ